jgi:hypothetical protein
LLSHVREVMMMGSTPVNEMFPKAHHGSTPNISNATNSSVRDKCTWISRTGETSNGFESWIPMDTEISKTVI